MVTSRRILVLGLEFHQLRWSAGTQRRRRFRSCDLHLAATFLLGEDATGAAAISRKLMYLDPCEPRNRTEQVAPTITRRNLGTLKNFFLLREALRDSLRKCLDFTDSYKAILTV